MILYTEQITISNVVYFVNPFNKQTVLAVSLNNIEAIGNTVIANYGGDQTDDRIYYVSSATSAAPNAGGDILYFQFDDETGNTIAGPFTVPCAVGCLPDNLVYTSMAYLESTNELLIGDESGNLYFVNPATAFVNNTIATAVYQDDMANPVSSLGADIEVAPDGTVYLLTAYDGALSGALFTVDIITGNLTFVAMAEDALGNPIYATGMTILSNGQLAVSTDLVSGLPAGGDGSIYLYNEATLVFDIVPNTQGNAFDDLASYPLEIDLQLYISGPTPVAPATGTPYGVGEQFTYSVFIQNNSVQHTAYDITACVPIPTGFSVVSAIASQGFYNEFNCEWIVANGVNTLEPGDIESLTITLEIDDAPDEKVTFEAQIVDSCPDVDSTPGNFIPDGDDMGDEDDEDEFTINLCRLNVWVEDCFQGNEGGTSPFNYNTACIHVEDGEWPFKFTWNTEGFVKHAVVDNDQINVIYYDNAEWTVTITDANGCSVTATNGDQPGDGDPLLDIVNYNITACTGSSSNGSIELNVAGGNQCGTPAYNFEWEGPSCATSNCGALNTMSSSNPNIAIHRILQLGSGWYSVTITDCSDPAQVTQGWYWVPCLPAGGGGGIRGKAEETAASLLSVQPNPFSETTNIQFVISESMNLRVSVYGIDGKLVETLYDDYAKAGEPVEINFTAQNLPNGIYVVKLQTENGMMQHQKVVLSR